MVTTRLKPINLLRAFQRSIAWLEANTVDGGIAVSSKRQIGYPEVTGYFLPTLRRWGFRRSAKTYADWLISVQNADGAWYAPGTSEPYSFDTAQILKGLLSLVDRDKEPYARAAERASQWLGAQILEDGRMTTPSQGMWNLPGGRKVPEYIHVYCLQPLLEYSQLVEDRALQAKVQKSIDYYSRQVSDTRFDTLTHFYAYLAEGWVDLARQDFANSLMRQLELFQSRTGKVCAYPEVRWSCLPAQFQLAVVWFKMASQQRGSRSFLYGVKHQNSSGGFYGSHGFFSNYFPRAEVSWAIKYFLDALELFVESQFDLEKADFPETIDRSDGRYQWLIQQIRGCQRGRVLDAGCGKGRFVNQLSQDLLGLEWHGMDISESLLGHLSPEIKSKKGSLLNLPYPDDWFDVVYTVEALEHAINLEGAIGELVRVLKPEGCLIVLDKNKNSKRKLKLSSWEQWFNREELKAQLEKAGCKVSTASDLPYENRDGRDGLFIGWLARKQIGAKTRYMA